jgi:hypothetical protein
MLKANAFFSPSQGVPKTTFSITTLQPNPVAEGDFATFRVSRDNVTGLALVKFVTQDVGSAKSGFDYEPVDKILEFRRGVSFIDVKVKTKIDGFGPFGDTQVNNPPGFFEPLETFKAVISPLGRGGQTSLLSPLESFVDIFGQSGDLIQ